jgi:hypothetical protein
MVCKGDRAIPKPWVPPQTPCSPRRRRRVSNVDQVAFGVIDLLRSASSPTVSMHACKGMTSSRYSSQPMFSVRRAKALSFSGCESRPAAFAPTGSRWSSREVG